MDYKLTILHRIKKESFFNKSASNTINLPFELFAISSR